MAAWLTKEEEGDEGAAVLLGMGGEEAFEGTRLVPTRLHYIERYGMVVEILAEEETMTAMGDLLSEGTAVREVFSGEDATAFRTLNEEWISRWFTLEARDREVLGDPETHILRDGGHLYFAECDGVVVGCVALIAEPGEPGVYELSKMAVSPEMRGLGIGRVLLAYAIEEGRRLGARKLFLGSSKKLENAVHLYEAMGFRHVARETLPIAYGRADVFMEMVL